MFVIQLMLICPLLHQVMSSGSGQHSLWALATFISGTTEFPEFSAVLMLDDIQVGHFDLESDRLTRSAGGEGAELDLGQEARSVLWEMFFNMRKRLTMVKHRFNLTTGVHVQQRLTGCEVFNDGRPALIMFRDSSNGQDANSLMYNMTHFTYAGGEGWEWGAMKRMQVLYSNIYLPFCAWTLNHLLDCEKLLVARRVRPRVHLMTKQVMGRARVTCLATDFYPHHINLTLLRDGRPMDESELTGGVVLPNCNSLYQVRKTLMVGDEDLHRKHNYTCVTAHLSLDNHLQVSWRDEFSRSHRIPVISAPVGLMLIAVLMVALLWCRRRHRERSEVVTVETEEAGQAAGSHLSR